VAQNHSELIFLVPWFVLLVISITMFIQGWMIMNAHHGYSKNPKVKHPELNNVRAGDPLLVVRFTDEDMEELQKRVLEQKMNELFEEPSSYEDEEDEQNNL
jgi:1-acyl-sn-glycerol-3-phosphate acyltransferase